MLLVRWAAGRVNARCPSNPPSSRCSDGFADRVLQQPHRCRDRAEPSCVEDLPVRGGRELAGAWSVADALAGYDKRRRRLARRVQTTAGMLQRLCGIEQVTTLRVRDALLAGLARFPRLSKEGIRRALAADVRTVRSASLLDPR
jgi:hypothetical protein